MREGGDELAGGQIPELGGFVRTRRQNPSAIRTKRHGLNRILMGEGGDQRELAAFNKGLCVITSRLPVADIADHERTSALRRDLEQLSGAPRPSSQRLPSSRFIS